MRYLVQERIFSFKADFWIEDENGNRVFFVDGKALSLRETFELKDASGHTRALIRKKLFAMRETMDIEDGDGVIATVRPAFFSPIKHRYEVTLADGSRLEATGNFTDKDWQLTSDGRAVGRISRQWFRIRDAYGVEVEPGEDDALIIAIAVCIDRIHEDEERKHREQQRLGAGFGHSDRWLTAPMPTGAGDAPQAERRFPRTGARVRRAAEVPSPAGLRNSVGSAGRALLIRSASV
jgi:uncharacterized protein YxjI